jgi:hypothetical protein
MSHGQGVIVCSPGKREADPQDSSQGASPNLCIKDMEVHKGFTAVTAALNPCPLLRFAADIEYSIVRAFEPDVMTLGPGKLGTVSPQYFCIATKLPRFLSLSRSVTHDSQPWLGSCGGIFISKKLTDT